MPRMTCTRYPHAVLVSKFISIKFEIIMISVTLHMHIDVLMKLSSSIVTTLELLPSISWIHHQMDTFSSSLALCAANIPVTGEFPPQRLVTQSFDVFSGLPLQKRLSKCSRRRWLGTPSRSLWCHRNDYEKLPAPRQNFWDYMQLWALCIATQYPYFTGPAYPLQCGRFSF